MIVYGHEVERWKIQEYFTDEILRNIDLYFMIKKYGWPYGGGWAEQPINIFRLVKALDFEVSKREHANRQSKN